MSAGVKIAHIEIVPTGEAENPYAVYGHIGGDECARSDGSLRAALDDVVTELTHLLDPEEPVDPDDEDLDSAFPYNKLASLGIVRVEVSYAGSGDEGNINDVVAYGEEQQLPLDLPREVEDDIDGRAADLLSDEYGSWGDNEGSSGTIDILVSEKKAVIHHGWVVESYEYHHKEVT